MTIEEPFNSLKFVQFVPLIEKKKERKLDAEVPLWVSCISEWSEIDLNAFVHRYRTIVKNSLRRFLLNYVNSEKGQPSLLLSLVSLGCRKKRVTRWFCNRSNRSGSLDSFLLAIQQPAPRGQPIALRIPYVKNFVDNPWSVLTRCFIPFRNLSVVSLLAT